MGEAKRRGSYEERKKAAKIKEAAYVVSLPPRKKYRPSKKTGIYIAIAAALGLRN